MLKLRTDGALEIPAHISVIRRALNLNRTVEIDNGMGCISFGKKTIPGGVITERVVFVQIEYKDDKTFHTNEIDEAINYFLDCYDEVKKLDE